MYNLTLKIYRKELQYDVDLQTYKVGQRLLGDAEAKQRAEMQSDNETAWFFERAYRKAIADIRNSSIYFKAEKSTESVADDDKLGANLSEYYQLVFTMPYDVSADIEKTIVEYIHHYCVYMALSEWFKLTAPQESQEFYTKAQEVYSSITQTFLNVAPTKRRTLYGE